MGVLENFHFQVAVLVVLDHFPLETFHSQVPRRKYSLMVANYCIPVKKKHIKAFNLETHYDNDCVFY